MDFPQIIYISSLPAAVFSLYLLCSTYNNINAYKKFTSPCSSEKKEQQNTKNVLKKAFIIYWRGQNSFSPPLLAPLAITKLKFIVKSDFFYLEWICRAPDIL
jgi:hypothetical protein